MIEAIFLVGNSGSGKTTAVYDCAQRLQKQGWSMGGIIAPGTFVNGVRFSFDVLDLATNERVLLASRDMQSPVTCGPFGFSLSGLEFGYWAVREAIRREVDILIIDEIGPLELKNEGWAPVLREAVSSNIKRLLLTIRPEVLEKTIQTFLSRHTIVSVVRLCPECLETLDRLL